MALLQTYFDELYDDDILCVAGYIFTKLRCHKLARDWKEMLRRFGLPYFRMSSCAHGNGVFGGMSKEDRVLAQTLAMALVQRYASSGVAVTVERSAFDKYMGGDDFIKTPYEFCVWMCLVGVSNWADATSWSGNISYIFEAGHQHQSNANSMMHYIFSNQILRRDTGMGGMLSWTKRMRHPVRPPICWRGSGTRRERECLHIRSDQCARTCEYYCKRTIIRCMGVRHCCWKQDVELEILPPVTLGMTIRWHNFPKRAIERFRVFVHSDLARGFHESLELALIDRLAAARRLPGWLW